MSSGNAALGSHWDGDGVRFRVYSGCADDVTLCLFDDRRNEISRHALAHGPGDVWDCFVPAIGPGQLYGYRVHGRYAPSEGLRCNPHKLLLDPWCRDLRGELQWSPAVYDFDPAEPDRMSLLDSADFVPRSVVAAPHEPAGNGPDIPWTERVIYEANVRGFTMQHPDVSAPDRGRFRGMSNGAVLEYLRALGITSVELQPVQHFVDERFLHDRGQRNFWGYNTLAFFVPAARYAASHPTTEFRDMVRAIHDAGLEVFLDVVYNHTAEGDELGPCISFRGLDNLAYYRTEAGAPERYVNDTGCGNSLNADHPVVQDLVLDSLAYWHHEMGVDGFRFDLAVTLGRDSEGFSSQHPLLERLGSDRRLSAAQFIAEPWDVGPHGYRLGGFPPRWAEWNDRYRDSVRCFWRGDPNSAGALARRMHGSADLFESSGRSPAASVNFVTSHDGFTLADLVSYEERRNEANGEGNHDGHAHNCSQNFGVEGPTADKQINERRRRHRLNFLATLLLSQGTPMLLAGDELGNSQSGNNNAYCQDNAVGWTDWSGLEHDAAFVDQVRTLLHLRRTVPLLRQTRYLHTYQGDGIQWLRADGGTLCAEDWAGLRRLGLRLFETGPQASSLEALILINGADAASSFRLPADDGDSWRPEFYSAAPDTLAINPDGCHLDAQSVACLLRGRPTL